MLSSSRQRFDEFRKHQQAAAATDAAAGQTAPVPSPGTAGATDAGAADTGARPAGTKGARRHYLRQYIGWLKPFRRAIIQVFIMAVAAALLGLILPVATKYAVDDVLGAPTDAMDAAAKASALTRFGVTMLVIIAVQQTIFLIRQWRVAVLNARVIVRLRRRLYWHLLHLPLRDLSDMKSGGLVSRLSGDLDQVTGMLQIAVITPGVAGMKVILTIGFLLYISWQMALGATLLILPLVAINLLYIRRVRPIYRAMRKDREQIDGRVAETFGGIRVVRAFARERGELRGYTVGHQTVVRKQLLAQRFELLVGLGWGVLIPLVSLLIVWVGGYYVLRGSLTIGGIIAFQMYCMMLLQPVSAIVQSYGETQQALAALERVFDLLNRPVDKRDTPEAVPAPAQVREIAFEKVQFSYRAGVPILKGIDLTVKAGQNVALVGPSGAGKTTITNLVARFYDPNEGIIRLNGVDLKQIKLARYRKMLAYVPQDVFLFDGTVAENIAFGRRNALDAEIRSAAERANADQFIRSLPEGYDTLVGERGIKLSGGQAQRLSIARAFLADPQILIMDEATSNLDTESEELIQSGMAELIVGRTTFIIAHRLSTIMHADQIIVVDEGRIVEQGTHDELLARGETYRKMVERQFRQNSMLDTSAEMS